MGAHLECWKCRGEEMPPEDCSRLALCEEHLRERVFSLMADRGKPAA
jgi:hypothetical protein